MNIAVIELARPPFAITRSPNPKAPCNLQLIDKALHKTTDTIIFAVSNKDD